MKFVPFLKLDDSKHICTCLKCGFHDEKNDHVHCPLREKKEHTDPCKDCSESFHLFKGIFEFHSKMDKQLKNKGAYENNIMLEDDMKTWRKNIQVQLRNFLHYRGHIAQAIDEAEWDRTFYAKLGEDECIIVFDFKMKILASFYREKQKDWFSKRGFSCLGVMIIFGRKQKQNNNHDNINNEDENDVMYHMFFSNDTTQDAIYVNTVKEFLYKHVLPLHGIKKVHYRADGAGVFISKVAKMAIGLWKDMTGIDEVTYKNNVPGKGKTKLDGAFGKMTQHLHRKVDEGNSFNSAEELFQLMKKFPLQYTVYHLLNLKRDQVNWTAQLPKCLDDESFGREFYLLTNNDGRVIGKCYSNHSKGRELACLNPDSKSMIFLLRHYITFLFLTQESLIQKN